MFSVRKETKKDRLEIERLIYQVLNSLDDNPCYEHYYVCKLRGTKDFNKDLTFVAEEYGKLLGFVTLSNAVIKDGDNEVQTLLLRPVVVHEEYQRRGIGKSLIKAALDEARFFGHKHVFVYGEKEYFAKLGFTSTGAYEVYNQEGKKEKNMLVIQFKIGSLDNVKGRLIEAKVFNEFNQEEFDYYHHALFMVKEKKEIKIKNTKKYTVKQILQAIMDEYQVSKTKVQAAVYGKRKRTYSCQQCGKRITKSESTRNSGICDACVSKSIEL